MFVRAAVTIALVAIYAAAGFGAVYVAYTTIKDPFGAGKEEFLKLAGIGLTLVSAVMAGLITLINTNIQIHTTQNIEQIKPLLALEFPAYRDLNGAALGYHDVLSRLATGNFDLGLVTEAEKEMKKCYGSLYFLPDEFQDAWWAFWTQARNMKEFADKSIATNPAFDQKAYWNDPKGDGVKLGALLGGLHDLTPRRRQ